MGQMMNSFGLDRLSPDDRLRLAEELYESFNADPSFPSLTDAQRADLDRRIAEDDADPEGGLTLEELMTQLRSKRGC